jgi:O-Antigen ligase
LVASPKLAPPFASAQTMAVMNNPMRIVGVFMTLLFLFVTHSRILEILVPVSGLIMAMALVALFGAVLGGDLTSAIKSRSGVLLIGFTIWMIAAIPFSSWPGGSIALVKNVWLKSVIVYYLIAGVLLTVKDARKALYTIAFATVTIAILSFKFATSARGRLEFYEGTLSNSNDLAVYLLVGTPFCAYALMRASRGMKIFWLLAIVLILNTALHTGSRSAILGIVAATVYIFVKSSPMIKLAFASSLVVLVLAAPIVLPATVLVRYASMFGVEVDKGADEDAAWQAKAANSSSEGRWRLFVLSLEFTARNPIFGVGPDMFPVAAADYWKAQGIRPDWHETHNMYTQISSENGIPALLMYAAALAYAFRNTGRLLKRAAKDPALKDVWRMAACLRISWVMLLTTGFFGSIAYNIQVLILLGITEAVYRSIVTEHKMAPQYAVLPRIATQPILTPRLVRS